MNNPSETNEVCIKCGLWKGCKTPFMPAHGPEDAKLTIVGEAPGAQEDEIGIPFVGQSGELLRNVLREVGFDPEKDVRYTNVVRCRPPDNKLGSKAIIKACSQFAHQELAGTPQGQIWLMGGSALMGILGEVGITAWNGIKVEKGGNTFVPLYHPAYILRNMNMLDEWLDAMLKAVDGEEERKGFERVIINTVQGMLEMQLDLAEYDVISYDTETSDLNPYAEYSFVLSASFARPGRAYAFPLDHPETPWSVAEREQVYDILCDILMSHNGRVVGHNIKFDQLHTLAYADIDFAAGGDSMLISHLLDSRRGIHGLKHLAGMHLGMYEYEQELSIYINSHPEANPHKGGSYAFVPLDILLPYGAMDAEATLLLVEKLYDSLSDAQRTLYDEMVIPASNVLCRMQSNGLNLDTYIAARYAKIYNWRQHRLYEELQNDPKVRRMVKKHATNKKWKFNPNSSYHLSELYFEQYKIPVVGETPKGRPSTSAKLYKNLEERFPILHKVRYYKLLTKMLGTYIEPVQGKWLSADGRVRSTYLLHGTVTGRLASEQPNLQNIPTPEKEPGTLLETLPIKNVFTHTYKGGLVMSVDYSGMELRVFASVAKCMLMISIHKSGLDFHRMVAALSLRMISKNDMLQVDDWAYAKAQFQPIIGQIDKPTRYVYKWTNWTLLYGGDEYTLHRMYDVPIEDAQETVRMYYDMFPEVLEYRESCREFAEDHGYIESPFGRRAQLPYINDRDNGKRHKAVREAVNMPVQSAASDTLLCAAIIINRYMQEQCMKSMLVNTVHDSLMIDAHPKEIEHLAHLCKTRMENISKYAAVQMPNVDFSWLISPLKADVDVGTHYGVMEDIDEWMKK